MQIQWWEGAVSSCAEAVPQSATRDSMSREAGCLRKRIVKSVVEELEKEIRCAARHRGRERVETREGFELERAASCRSREHRWRTQLDFSSGESFDDPHRPTTLGARPKIARTGGGNLLVGLWRRAEQLEAKW